MLKDLHQVGFNFPGSIVRNWDLCINPTYFKMPFVPKLFDRLVGLFTKSGMFNLISIAGTGLQSPRREPIQG